MGKGTEKGERRKIHGIYRGKGLDVPFLPQRGGNSVCVSKR